MVLDRARFPRDKVCAGWITPAVVEALDLDLAATVQGRTFSRLQRVSHRTHRIGGEVETSYDRPVSFGIRRCEFDTYLLERSGARLRLGTPVAAIRRDGPRWIVNDAIAARCWWEPGVISARSRGG